MQRALTELGSGITPTAAKVVTVIGTDPGSVSRISITSAFAHAGLSGWGINYVSGASNITTYFSTLSTSNSRTLYLSTAALTGGEDQLAAGRDGSPGAADQLLDHRLQSPAFGRVAQPIPQRHQRLAAITSMAGHGFRNCPVSTTQ